MKHGNPMIVNLHLREQLDTAIITLRLCQRLFDEALPKFNWGASALDANAIRLLNDTPIEVHKALAKLEAKP